MTKFKAFAFLDRDGAINEEGSILTVNDLKLIPGAIEAIKLLNANNFCVVIVSNQPQVAKGFCSEQDVKKINVALVKILADNGAKIDAIYYCPHHPEKGHPGENPKYKIKCKCRKPGLAMFQKAAKKFRMKIGKNSIVIGDQTRDIEAGKKLGAITIMVKTGFAGKDNTFSVKPKYVCKDLLAAVKTIL